jgi:hypothetical protein
MPLTELCVGRASDYLSDAPEPHRAFSKQPFAIFLHADEEILAIAKEEARESAASCATLKPATDLMGSRIEGIRVGRWPILKHLCQPDAETAN